MGIIQELEEELEPRFGVFLPSDSSSFTAVPFIGSLRVGGPMAASVGDQVTPGNLIEIGTGEELGSGIHSTERGHVALVSGSIVNNSGVISVDSNVPPLNSPKMGLSLIHI